MSNLLQQLENNEAILLMYLAGELPDGDRAEVEQMLAADPALRAELAELTALRDGTAMLVGGSDAATGGGAARADAAGRFVARAIVAANAGAARPSAVAGVNGSPAAALKLNTRDDQDAPRQHRRRLARWAYPIAAAAMLALGLRVYHNANRPPLAPAGPMPDLTTTERPAQYALVPTILPDTDRDPLSALEEEGFSLRTPGGAGLFSESSDGAGDLER